MRKLLKIWDFGWPYMKRYWVRLSLGVALGLVFGATNMSFVWAAKTLTGRMVPVAEAENLLEGPKLVKAKWLEDLKERMENGTERVIDDWLPRTGRALDGQQVVGLMLLLPLLMAARGFTGYLSSYCLAWVSERVVHALRMRVIDKFHELSLEYFNRSKSGDMITRVNEDTGMVQRTLSLVFSDLIKEPATIVCVFGLMILIDWRLSLFVMLFLPVCVVPLVILGRRIRKAAKGRIAARVTQSSLLIEALAGIRVVKAFNLEEQQRRRFDHQSRQIMHHNMKSTQAGQLSNPIIETISIIGLAGLLLYIFHTQAKPEDLVGLVAAVVIMFTPVKKLGRVHMVLAKASVGVDRLFSLYSERPSVAETGSPREMRPFEREIELREVSFAYGEDRVLKDLALRIPRGHMLGIAGESGSGKSTLINLFLRFYDPTKGRILIDGVDVKDVRNADLRNQLALVSQDVVVFDMTIGENIAVGREGATRKEIEQAAKDAFAHDFIMAMPQGYDTPVGERGVTLSGGQRQRLAIARAFVKDAPILLLDEATAALDSKAEAEVQKAIDKLERDRTVICIAHRLATLAAMDRIIVLRRGRIVESGSFEELLAKGGDFADMARQQGISQ